MTKDPLQPPSAPLADEADRHVVMECLERAVAALEELADSGIEAGVPEIEETAMELQDQLRPLDRWIR